MFDWVPELLQ